MAKKHLLSHKTFWIIIGILIAAIVASYISFTRWQKEHFYGRVLSVNQNEIQIQDVQTGVRTIYISPETFFGKGRQTANTLHIGDEIFVIGNIQDNGKIQAKGIRIVDIKKK